MMPLARIAARLGLNLNLNWLCDPVTAWRRREPIRRVRINRK